MQFYICRVKHVYGYEVVPEAVADARRNAARNDITNATFIEGNLNKIQKCFADQIPQPDVVIIGMVLQKLSKLILFSS